MVSPSPSPDVEPGVDEHARAQLPLGVRNVDPHTDGSFQWINERFDHRDLAAEFLVTERRRGDLEFLAAREKWQLVFVKLRAADPARLPRSPSFSDLSEF